MIFAVAVAAASASLFFSAPAPLDMPRADAYMVSGSDGSRWLEDRYDTFDLWLSRAVIGRWMDDDLRVFVLARLDVLPPALREASYATRAEYERQRVPADPKDDERLAGSVDLLSPVETASAFYRPRQKPRGMKDVRFYQGTNTSAIVCAFAPEGAGCWFLATWELAPDDEFAEMEAGFIESFFDKKAYERLPVWESVLADAGRTAKNRRRRGGRAAAESPERELLRADAGRNVAAYPDWHATDSPEFIVLDNLPARGFVESLTNDMPVMRAKYAAAVPSPVDGSNTLCVVRIFSNRDDYLEAAGDGMEWTAAYWSPSRRELVAYLPGGGEAELLKTLRHEAFHQYLSYACSMLPASPWFNEGYAQYFEDEDSADWQIDRGLVDLDRLEETLPAVLGMDYRQFYDGTDLERRLKYRIAWSMAVFLEKGARKVRFDPFKNLKRDYIEYLLKTRDMHAATSRAFGSTDNMKRFAAEWKAYWLKNM